MRIISRFCRIKYIFPKNSCEPRKFSGHCRTQVFVPPSGLCSFRFAANALTRTKLIAKNAKGRSQRTQRLATGEVLLAVFRIATALDPKRSASHSHAIYGVVPLATIDRARSRAYAMRKGVNALGLCFGGFTTP
ncbi:MAG: hypothetical protein DYH05_02040 [Acidobacteria bacterium ACB1]|nr:hypothetical protein [Acidobacteria bacterium ACB1]